VKDYVGESSSTKFLFPDIKKNNLQYLPGLVFITIPKENNTPTLQFHSYHNLQVLPDGFCDELTSDFVCQFQIFSKQENKCIILAHAVMFQGSYFHFRLFQVIGKL